MSVVQNRTVFRLGHEGSMNLPGLSTSPSLNTLSDPMIWSLSSVLFTSLSLWVAKLLIDFVRYEHIKRRMPPGPPGVLLIGNLHQIGKLPFIRFTEWAQRYGGILPLHSSVCISLTCWCRTHILASSGRPACDRLERLHHYRGPDRSCLQHAFLVCCNVDDAVVLVDRRSTIYSDRPKLIMANLISKDLIIVLTPYGDL